MLKVPSESYRTVQQAIAFGGQYYRFPGDVGDQAVAALSTLSLEAFSEDNTEEVRAALVRSFRVTHLFIEGAASQTPRYDIRSSRDRLTMCSRIVGLSVYPAAEHGQRVQPPALFKLAPRLLKKDTALLVDGDLDGTYFANFKFASFKGDRFLFFRIREGVGQPLNERGQELVVHEINRAAKTLDRYKRVNGGDYPRYYTGIPDDLLKDVLELQD